MPPKAGLHGRYVGSAKFGCEADQCHTIIEKIVSGSKSTDGSQFCGLEEGIAEIRWRSACKPSSQKRFRGKPAGQIERFPLHPSIRVDHPSASTYDPNIDSVIDSLHAYIDKVFIDGIVVVQY
jgi:hypothetical protein